MEGLPGGVAGFVLHEPGKPLANDYEFFSMNHGLFSTNLGQLQGIAAHYLGYLAVQEGL